MSVLHNLCISPFHCSMNIKYHGSKTSYHGYDETAKDLLLGNNSNKHYKHCPLLILQGALVHSKPIFTNQKS